MNHDAAPARAANPRKILVVDDNVDFAESLRDFLEVAGHKATVATSVVEALELAGKVSPDVVISDIELPVMDGYELAQRLREIPELANSLFIALTGYSQSNDPRQLGESAFAHHLVKPIDVDRLLKLVSETAGP
jgi:CheY-like chemotaxis protein